MRKYSTTAMASTITKISSMVMPEVMCPKPFSMRNGCWRWKNTDRPPMASATIALMREGELHGPALAGQGENALHQEDNAAGR